MYQFYYLKIKIVLRESCRFSVFLFNFFCSHVRGFSKCTNIHFPFAFGLLFWDLFLDLGLVSPSFVMLPPRLCIQEYSLKCTEWYCIFFSGHFDPFQIARKIRPIGERLRNHSDQSEDVLRIFNLYICLFQKNEIFFPVVSFDFDQPADQKELFHSIDRYLRKTTQHLSLPTN